MTTTDALPGILLLAIFTYGFATQQSKPNPDRIATDTAFSIVQPINEGSHSRSQSQITAFATRKIPASQYEPGPIADAHRYTLTPLSASDRKYRVVGTRSPILQPYD